MPNRSGARAVGLDGGYAMVYALKVSGHEATKAAEREVKRDAKRVKTYGKRMNDSDAADAVAFMVAEDKKCSLCMVRDMTARLITETGKCPHGICVPCARKEINRHKQTKEVHMARTNRVIRQLKYGPMCCPFCRTPTIEPHFVDVGKFDEALMQ